MKKILLVILFSLVLVVPAYALNLGGKMVKDSATIAGYGEARETTLAEIVGTVIKTVLTFVGVIFLALMVYAGYLWMTARGEEDQIKKARDIVKSSIIGFIITVGAYSITNFIVPQILEKTTTNKLPAEQSSDGGGDGSGDKCFKVCWTDTDGSQCVEKSADDCDNYNEDNGYSDCSEVKKTGDKTCENSGKTPGEIYCCVLTRNDASGTRNLIGGVENEAACQLYLENQPQNFKEIHSDSGSKYDTLCE